MIMKRFGLAAIALSLLALQGCATSIKASALQNPPPAYRFSAYGHVELKSAVFTKGYDGSADGLAKIDGNIKLNLASYMTTWNAHPNGQSLIIEPVIEELEFKHGAQRVLLGPLAGSSGVLMRLNIRDANGVLLASPEFFQRADAMAAGFIFGIHDNMMLTRVAGLASNYVIANYDRAVGGPTGADDKNLK